MSKRDLISESAILTKANEIQEDTVAMIAANNLAIQRLETVYLKFDLTLLKTDKKIYELRRDLEGAKSMIGALRRDYPSKAKKIRRRR